MKDPDKHYEITHDSSFWELRPTKHVQGLKNIRSSRIADAAEENPWIPRFQF